MLPITIREQPDGLLTIQQGGRVVIWPRTGMNLDEHEAVDVVTALLTGKNTADSLGRPHWDATKQSWVPPEDCPDRRCREALAHRTS